VTSSSKI